MKNTFLKLIFGSFIFLSVAGGFVKNVNSQTSQNVWNPNKTWVFFVGLVEWKDKKTFASFPQENRRDKVLLDVLRERGVPENQIVYLQDSAATTAKIQTSFEAFLLKTQPGDTVFFYYCGHGYKSDDNLEAYLAGYDASDKIFWKAESVPDTIDKFFKGERAVIMLDNCFSGAMAEAVKARNSKISYAVLASSRFNSFSTGNWTFTESLIYAFRGASFIDDDANGKIDLGELSENAAEDMLFAEDQLAEFAFTGNLNNQTIITENVPKPALRVGERVEAFDQGNWYRAIITEVTHDQFKVHFFGYEYDEDTFLNATQLRQFKPKTFAVGSKIQAESEGKWYPAKILEVKGGAHLVSYDGYGEEWNEWISSDRIRRKK